MTQKKILFICIILLLNLSCSNDDSESNDTLIDNFNIENYHGVYAQYGFNLNLNSFYNGDNLIKFKYDNQGRIIKRNGDILYAHPASGLGGSLHDSLYTSLVYTNNKVHMEKKIAPFGGLLNVEENQTTITFDDNNRIIQKITFEEWRNPQIDTTHYNYDNNGKLISYIKTSLYVQNSNSNSRNYEESNLYYSNNNLDSIVTLKSAKWNESQHIRLIYKKTQHFSGYDNAENPFRKLQLFEETFNRSLNENNFTEYIVTSNDYDYPNNDLSQTPTLSETQQDYYHNWGFAYDENGNWIYDEF